MISLFLLLAFFISCFSITAVAGFEYTKQQRLKENIEAIIFLSIFMGIVLVMSLKANKEVNIIREELKENPNLPTKLYKKLVPNYLSPAEFVCLFCKNYLIWFFVCIAELSKQKVVKIGPHYEHIAYPVKYEKNDILDVLEECRLFAQQKSIKINCENNYWILPLKCLDMFFENQKNCYKLYDLWRLTKYNMRVSQSQEFKYLYNKMFYLYEYFFKSKTFIRPISYTNSNSIC